MILFYVLFAEGIVVFLLLLNTGPLRELVIRMLDQLKVGMGPAIITTVACTVSVFFISSAFSIFKMQNKGAKLGTMSPMDQVLLRTHLLDASLIGFTLFLGFIIYFMHPCLRQLVELTTSLGSSKEEVERLQKENAQLKQKEEKASKDVKTLQEQVSTLSENVKKLRLETEEKTEQIATAEAHVASLQKQSADLLLEYDRLLEDNQNLQAQALGCIK